MDPLRLNHRKGAAVGQIPHALKAAIRDHVVRWHVQLKLWRWGREHEGEAKVHEHFEHAGIDEGGACALGVQIKGARVLRRECFT